jgi:hypothetical protein
VPAKPSWYSKVDYITAELRSSTRPLIDRATIEFLFGVGRRRAQQIMAPCITDRVGTNGLADRDALIARVRRLAEGDDGHYEIERRRKVANLLDRLRTERIHQPQLLVEAPVHVVNQEFEDLPAGVRLERGRICVDFDTPQQGLEKLLALAMAISNDFERFERMTNPVEPTVKEKKPL